RGMMDQVAEQASEVGLDYRLSEAVMTNTFDAHRLTHYANDKGKAAQVTERLLKAYFIDSLHLGDHQVLAKLAAEAGLDEAETLAMLKSDQYSEQVRQDQAKGAQLGIKGVPFFVFDSKYAVSGAQPSNVFGDILNKVWEETKGQPVLQVLNQDDEDGESAGNCADGSCKL
ncbi:MAG: DsbA family oxidoreductase, partial [Clostridia bacterium]